MIFGDILLANHPESLSIMTERFLAEDSRMPQSGSIILQAVIVVAIRECSSLSWYVNHDLIRLSCSCVLYPWNTASQGIQFGSLDAIGRAEFIDIVPQ